MEIPFDGILHATNSRYVDIANTKDRLRQRSVELLFDILTHNILEDNIRSIDDAVEISIQ